MIDNHFGKARGKPFDSAQGRQPYDPDEIEERWQKQWEKNNLYQAVDFSTKPKKYILIEFPYPSGERLHVGHGRSYTALDALARKYRMQGFNVLYPIGWDAFGLPAENYAIKTGINPNITTSENIKNAKIQAKRWGLSFDWSREINTTDPKYYRWTQWIFLKMLEKGLAYQAEVPVNWCPACKTNLADEEVLADGTHERCGNKTEKRLQRQWILKITAYADRLLEDLKLVNYLPKIAQQQINWIGKSEGVEIEFQIVDGVAATNFSVATSTVEQKFQVLDTSGNPSDVSEVSVASSKIVDRRPFKTITVFTTAHDTIFGATFMVLAPEYTKQLLDLIPESRKEEVADYIKKSLSKSELERKSETKIKTGVDTGLKVINPFSKKEMSVYVADYVLMGYGTGAVMGVPGHDARDHEFAKKYNLPIISVIQPQKGRPFVANVEKDGFWDYEEIKNKYSDDSELFDSGFLNGLTSNQAKKKIEEKVEKRGIGKKIVHYHLRDWVFSRQHYWGEPIPVIYCANCAKHITHNTQHTTLNGEDYAIVPVPEDQLPVKLPPLEKYQPTGTGESPLAAVKDWVNTKCPVCGGPARRETDTMPNWAGSNWYYLAYLIAKELGTCNTQHVTHNTKHNVIPSKARNLARMGVSRIRERSFANAQDDESIDIFSQNKKIIGYWMPVDLYNGGMEHTTLHLLYSRFIYKFLYDLGVVPTPEPYAKRRSHGVVLGPDGQKMSKSRGNVVNPDEVIKAYGADTFRLYEMFMGPFEEMIAWSDEGVTGCHRFLKRVWQLAQTKVKDFKTPQNLVISLNKTVKKVSEDLENLKFNTAIAAMMEFINLWAKPGYFLNKKEAKIFLQILAPFAPHITEELWQRRGGSTALKTLREWAKHSPGVEGLGKTWSIHQQPWPKYEKKEIEKERVTIVVEVNGKVREKLTVNSLQSTAKDEIKKLARESEKIEKYLKDQAIKQLIFVPGKLINFVTE